MKASQLSFALQVAAGQNGFLRRPAADAERCGRLLQQAGRAAAGKAHPFVARGIDTC
ncbi:MAG TPA: hypothetical protein VD969_21100 [Symbiobacteriaceae bacterium]|nr:hypothetical protein [Symbiobacteriaceae bacterium]